MLYEVKIADYGLSKYREEELKSLVGTPQYWAPEMMQRGRSFDRLFLEISRLWRRFTMVLEHFEVNLKGLLKIF